MVKVLDEVDKHRQEVKTDSYTATWSEILNQYKQQDIIVNPEYQRLFRWDIVQQTRFIESVLLSIPIPPLFFAKNTDGKFEVIDGLQRISTMVKFFSSEIFNEKNQPSDSDETINDLKVPTILTEAPIIKSLKNYSAANLPEPLMRNLRYARVSITLLEKESSPTARYEVFKRLNEYGSQLEDQEIRNCTARLFGSGFPEKLKGIALNTVIRSSLNLGTDREQKMQVEELILRLLAINHSEQPFTHKVSEFLDDFMVFASEEKFKFTPEIESKIIKTFDLINKAVPDGEAFRFPKGGFSTNLFDVVATGVYHNLSTIDANKFKTKFASLMKSKDLENVTGAGSNSRKKFLGRVDLGKSWFS